MRDTKPYTYYIAWSSPKMHYYGARWARGCSPDEFWTDYFTSSNHVKKFREIYGEPDVVKVCRTFGSKKDVLRWERKFLSRVDAKNRNDFLNMCNGFENVWDSSGHIWYNDGKTEFYLPKHDSGILNVGRLPKTEDVKKRTSETIKQLKWYNNGKKSTRAVTCPMGYMSGRLTFKRKSPTLETKLKMSKAQLGRKLSEKRKIQMSKNFSKRRWYNNGEKNIFQEICPMGFKSGRI